MFQLIATALIIATALFIAIYKTFKKEDPCKSCSLKEKCCSDKKKKNNF